MSAHSVLQEKPILSIETAVVLFCWPITMLDLTVAITRVVI